MKIKFLSFIAGFFVLSFVFTSCLKNDNDQVEYSPNATISAFALDTIGYGIDYAFTIDQLNGLIYNVDSIPMSADTIINKILIKTMTNASGLVTMKNKEGKDSIININDSIDLLPYVNGTSANNKYLEVTSWSPDMQVQKKYKISVRMHTQLPDSLNWGVSPMTTNPVPTAEHQKLVAMGNQIFLFTQNSNKVAILNLPADAKKSDPLDYGKNWDVKTGDNTLSTADVTAIISYSGKLYLVSDGKVYNSADGLSWTLDSALSPTGISVVKLITSFSNTDGYNYNNLNGIAGIIEKDGFTVYDFAQKAGGWSTKTGDQLNQVDAQFPTSNLFADVYSSTSGVLNGIVVGNTATGISDDATVIWTTEDGLNWYSMDTSSSYKCPKLTDPSIIYYNDAFYICGKDPKNNNEFQKFYISPSRLKWQGIDKLFMLPGVLPSVTNNGVTTHPTSPYTFKGKSVNYTMIADKYDFIWMIGGSTMNQVWRGRVNKLGFIIQ